MEIIILLSVGIFLLAALGLIFYSFTKHSRKYTISTVLTELKSKQAGSYIDCFYCHHKTKGPAVLFLSEDYLWCQNPDEEIFRIPMTKLVSVEYSKRNFYRINTQEGQQMICYLHEVEVGEAEMTAAYMDPEITDRFINQLKRLGISTIRKPHFSVFFFPDLAPSYGFALKHVPVEKFLLVIILTMIILMFIV